MWLIMGNYNIRELYCPSCGKISETPICCTIEMEIDGDIFFCSICGNVMKVREKEVTV
jgi:transcription elongation factor Elf1